MACSFRLIAGQRNEFVQKPMIHNYFGSFLSWLAKVLNKQPFVSTWIAAMFLSSVWTVAWLFVFFASTWFFDLETTAADLVNIFWLSIAAEAAIRWAENTNFVAQLSKPHDPNASGDNSDFRLVKALALFASSLALMFFFDFYMESIGIKEKNEIFYGQKGQIGYNHVTNMVYTWGSIISSSGIATPMLVGTLLRSWIYKRSHKEKPTEE